MRILAAFPALVFPTEERVPASIDRVPGVTDGELVERISLSLTMVSSRPRETGPRTLNWNQSLTVIIENGKPLVVVGTTDPATGRKLSVQVKGSILR
jgi:hypothetical protein